MLKKLTSRELPPVLVTAVAILGTAAALFVAACFFFYPAFQLVVLMRDPGIHATGRPSDLPSTFRSTGRRYLRWANGYLASLRAESVSPSDVAATEWPLFGTVFFMSAAEELVKDGSLRVDDELRASLNRAADVVVHPASAAWVKSKWGKDYLRRENVFYRMLVIMGLSSFEVTTGNVRYRTQKEEYARALYQELLAAKYHLADDYPGECYPNDVLWAVVAIQRALGRGCCDDLANGLMAVFERELSKSWGLPAFSVDARTAEVYQAARGSGNSGLLSFAGELNPVTAQRWYRAYEEHFWTGGFIKGFRETPKGSRDVTDVDSGPVVFGLGSVASAFGIGAARANGRFDHAAVLSMQALAASWPTPFGPLIPGAMGYLAADGWCFGELALSFALTRPSYVSATRPHDGSVPPLVWILLSFYIAGGLVIVVREAVYWRRRLSRSNAASPTPQSHS